jgi:hypothetical protein
MNVKITLVGTATASANRLANVVSASRRARPCSPDVTGSGPRTRASRPSGVSDVQISIVTRAETAIAKSTWNTWLTNRIRSCWSGVKVLTRA